MNKEQLNNKRVFEDYNRFKDLKGRYNAGRIDSDVFTLYRIKDGSIIRKFNVKTFDTVLHPSKIFKF